MREHGSLGPACGPRGISDQGRIERADLVEGHPAVGFLRRFHPGRKDLDSRVVLADPVRAFFLIHNGGGRARISDDMGQFRLAISGVGREHDGAQSEARRMSENAFQGTFVRAEDSLASANPGGREVPF